MGGIAAHRLAQAAVAAGQFHITDILALYKHDKFVHRQIHIEVFARIVQRVSAEYHVAHPCQLEKHILIRARHSGQMLLAAGDIRLGSLAGANAQIHHIGIVIIRSQFLGKFALGILQGVAHGTVIEHCAVCQDDEPLFHAGMLLYTLVGCIHCGNGSQLGMGGKDLPNLGHFRQIPDGQGIGIIIGSSVHLDGTHRIDLQDISRIHHGRKDLDGVGGLAPGSVSRSIHGTGIVKHDGNGTGRHILTGSLGLHRQSHQQNQGQGQAQESAESLSTSTHGFNSSFSFLVPLRGQVR